MGRGGVVFLAGCLGLGFVATTMLRAGPPTGKFGREDGPELESSDPLEFVGT